MRNPGEYYRYDHHRHDYYNDHHHHHGHDHHRHDYITTTILTIMDITRATL